MNRLFFLVIFYCFCLNTKFICTFENIIENHNIRFINFNKVIEEEWLNENSKELVNFGNNKNNENRIYFVYRAAASKEDFEQVLGKEEFYYNIIVFPVKGNSFKSSIEEEVRNSFFDSFANIYNRGKEDDDNWNILEEERNPLLTAKKNYFFFFIPVFQDENKEENSFSLSCLYNETKVLFPADDIDLTVYCHFYSASKKSSLCASIKKIIREKFFKEEEDKSCSCCPCCNFF